MHDVMTAIADNEGPALIVRLAALPMPELLRLLDETYSDGLLLTSKTWPQLFIGVMPDKATRVEVAMMAVKAKRDRKQNWRQFFDTWQVRMEAMQRDVFAMRQYWQSGPFAGLEGERDYEAPLVNNSGDWFITDLGGFQGGLVIGAGFNMLQGEIALQRSDGLKIKRSIRLMGPAVGVSGNATPKGFEKAFPNAAKAIGNVPTPKILKAAFDRIEDTAGQAGKALATLLQRTPGYTTLRGMAARAGAGYAAGELINGTSGAPASLPSRTLGVVPWTQRVRADATDFIGPCYMLGGQATASILGASASYIAFGKTSLTTFFEAPRAIGVVLGAGLQVAIPNSAGVNITFYVGDIR